MSEVISNNEESEQNELTSEKLASACNDILSPEDCQDIEAMECDEALGYTFTLLLENGIEDPEQYLIEKGILK